jgi:hypothetical protein
MSRIRLTLPILALGMGVWGLCVTLAGDDRLPPVRPGQAAVRATEDAGTPSASARSAGERLAALTQPAPRSVPDTAATPEGQTGPPPLFQAWPDPQAVLVLTGHMGGYIEPCGCAGKENMKGGLARRYTFLEELKERGWTPVPLDAGGMVKRFGPQPTIKYSQILSGLRKMGYQAIGFGPGELGLPDAISEVLEPANKFVSANVDLFEQVPKQKVITVGGRKIGVTSVLGDAARRRVQSSDFTLTPAIESLKPVAEQLKTQADVRVLLAYATPDEAKEIAKAVPVFDFIVVADGAAEPALQPSRVEGTPTTLIETGTKGMFAVAIGLYGDAKTPWRYQRVPLDSRFEDAPEMVAVMDAYQSQLKTVGFAGLGAKPRPHHTGRTFVGSATCADCHDTAHGKWLEQEHATALDTLRDLPVPRIHDPECISCHVVGWDPQRYIPYESGFVSREKTPELSHVGCETCHGPASEHVAAEMGEVDLTDEQIALRRTGVRITLDAAEKTCRECHDLDNSPKFDFKTYWPHVEHYEN